MRQARIGLTTEDLSCSLFQPCSLTSPNGLQASPPLGVCCTSVTNNLAMKILLLCLFLITFVGRINGRKDDIKLSDEDRLIKRLLARYSRKGTYSRPVRNHNEKITIKYNMQLIQIMGLDEKSQVLTLNVWDRYRWTDMHMTWEPDKYGGVDIVHVPSSKIWIPDFKLYNYADFRLSERRDALCVIDYNGTVTWMPQAIYKSSCEIDVTTFPFDIQNCTLKFGTWTHTGEMVDLMILHGDHGYSNGSIDMNEYVKSNSWEILHTPAVRHEEYYTCCPGKPYLDLSFTIIFQRRSAFYNYILVLPCILLTSLTLVLFWIPPESPAKLMLGINIFVAFFLLLLLMEGNLPPSSAKVPLLGTYYCLNMILITLSSFLNAFVVNLSFYGARRPLPSCIRQVMFEFFAKILFMDNLVSPFRDKTISELTSRLVGDRMPFLGMPLNGDKSSKWVRSDAKRSSGESLLLHANQAEHDLQLAELRHINSNLNELLDFLKSYKTRVGEKDRKERVAREWKAVSLIFDRIFFIVYLTVIITSLCVILPIITQPTIDIQS